LASLAMTMKPIPGFKSLPTHHCITGSMRHIYAFHDHPISEDMLLGLGAGLGFIYWHMKDTMPFLGGRANVGRSGEAGLEITSGQRTGVRVERHHTSSLRKAEGALLASLEAGEPVMLMVDMGFLPYLRLPDDFHFGGHAVAAGGYDDKASKVLIADRDEALHPVSLEDIAKARGSTFKPFPPRNTWFTFDFQEKRQPCSDEIFEAIDETCKTMLEGPISNLGVRGIRKAAAEILKWPDIMSKEELRWTCFNTFIFIDAEGGTGGGIFRYMYARFLEEAAAITGEHELAKGGNALQKIGDRWQEVGHIFKSGAESHSPGDVLQNTTEPLLEIADMEEAAWHNLRSIAS
jgi:hypothetical protein